MVNRELENFMKKLDTEPVVSESEFQKIFPRYAPGQFGPYKDPYPPLKRRASDGFIRLGDDSDANSRPSQQEFFPPSKNEQRLAIKNKREDEPSVESLLKGLKNLEKPDDPDPNESGLAEDSLLFDK